MNKMRPTIVPFLLPCVLIFILPSICRAVEINDCGSKIGKLKSITFSGCDMTKQACDLVRDTNATIDIDFSVEADVSKVFAVVHGIIMEIPIAFPLPNADACETSSSGIKCPVAKDTECHYSNSLPVLKSYPKISLVIKFELKDEKNEDILCLLIPARIK
ncbi:NPC intracellular cholesterol transporter 2 homolog a [Halictus rubicundus]|uniref:NPC intracellular cholesterol transporter 2 homolog a n=1 Tax=Halictus rubicundus TaxID=77578 RepID=UPI0040372EAF